MTKTGAKVFLEYIKELARDSCVPYTGFGNITLKVVVQDDKIINFKITGYEANQKPK